MVNCKEISRKRQKAEEPTCLNYLQEYEHEAFISSLWKDFKFKDGNIKLQKTWNEVHGSRVMLV